MTAFSFDRCSATLNSALPWSIDTMSGRDSAIGRSSWVAVKTIRSMLAGSASRSSAKLALSEDDARLISPFGERELEQRMTYRSSPIFLEASKDRQSGV